MASSYKARLLVPTTAPLTNVGFALFNQLSTPGSGVGYVGINGFMIAIAPFYEITYGGIITWVITVVGANNEVSISYDGLTTDPALTDDLVCLVFLDDNGNSYSAQWVSEDICIDEGLCPECPEPTPIDTTPCDICYDVTTDPCEDTIFLPGLDADTAYTLTLTDNDAGVTYTYEITTDETGEASVIIADFPVGAFSTFSNYTVTIVDENGDPAQVTIGYTTYDCYNLIFTPSTNVTSQG